MSVTGGARFLAASILCHWSTDSLLVSNFYNAAFSAIFHQNTRGERGEKGKVADAF